MLSLVFVSKICLTKFKIEELIKTKENDMVEDKHCDLASVFYIQKRHLHMRDDNSTFTKLL